jgi:hypothetical protein
MIQFHSLIVAFFIFKKQYAPRPGISPSTKPLPSQWFVWAPPRGFASAKHRSGVRVLLKVAQATFNRGSI